MPAAWWAIEAIRAGGSLASTPNAAVSPFGGWDIASARSASGSSIGPSLIGLTDTRRTVIEPPIGVEPHQTVEDGMAITPKIIDQYRLLVQSLPDVRVYPPDFEQQDRDYDYL